MKEMKEKIRYDEGPIFYLPKPAKCALEKYAISIANAQRNMKPEYAECWTHVRISIDDNFQPSFCFGGCPEDIDVRSDDNECCSWITETPDDIGCVPWITKFS